jgi:hypothetical protein
MPFGAGTVVLAKYPHVPFAAGDGLLVVTGTPIDLGRLIDAKYPIRRVVAVPALI